MDVPYLPNGYIDIERIRSMTRKTPFVFIIGARQGAGKTYGITKSIIEHEEKPVIIRRTKNERKNFANDKVTPLQRITKGIVGVNTNTITILYHEDAAGENNLGDIFGYVLDLDSSSKRGFAIPEFDAVFYDECVPEKYAGGKADNTQADTFYNLLITLFSEDPKFMDVSHHPKVWIVGNANALEAGIFRRFGITKTIEKMILTDKRVYISPQRALSIFLADAPENSARRAKMPLMMAAEQSAVTDMAMSNKFIYDPTGVKGWPLREFRALASFSNEYSAFTVWIHKREQKPFLYITRGAYPARYQLHNSKEAFTMLGRDTAYKSHRDFWYMVLHASSGKTVFYDSIVSKQWFQSMKK